MYGPVTGFHNMPVLLAAMENRISRWGVIGETLTPGYRLLGYCANAFTFHASQRRSSLPAPVSGELIKGRW